jgi:riboflavin synthase
VNLERALRLSDRLGGHLVTGHVDGIGTLVMRHPAGNSTVYQFAVPRELMEYVVPKGSIAVDGISLTIAQTRADGFAAAVVPHTESATTLGAKPTGSKVNVEVDMMAKYVKRFVELYAGIDEDALRPGRRGLGDMLRDLAEGR